MTKTPQKIYKAEPGWTMYRPGQTGKSPLLVNQVTAWCEVDGKTWPYDEVRKSPVIAAVQHASNDRCLIDNAEVPFEGLADRLRSMIDAAHIAAGRMKP